MFRKRLIAVIAGLALLAAVTGSSVVADVLGLSGTPQAHACGNPSSSGGGC